MSEPKKEAAVGAKRPSAPGGTEPDDAKKQDTKKSAQHEEDAGAASAAPANYFGNATRAATSWLGKPSSTPPLFQGSPRAAGKSAGLGGAVKFGGSSAEGSAEAKPETPAWLQSKPGSGAAPSTGGLFSVGHSGAAAPPAWLRAKPSGIQPLGHGSTGGTGGTATAASSSPGGDGGGSSTGLFGSGATSAKPAWLSGNRNASSQFSAASAPLVRTSSAAACTLAHGNLPHTRLESRVAVFACLHFCVLVSCWGWFCAVGDPEADGADGDDDEGGASPTANSPPPIKPKYDLTEVAKSTGTHPSCG